MNYSNQQNQTIVLKSAKQLRQFYVDQIMYISGSSYLSTIHLANSDKTETFSILLKQLEGKLASFGFLRINRNQLVNMKYFKQLKANQKRLIVLQNDKELCISCRKVPQVRQFLTQASLTLNDQQVTLI